MASRPRASILSLFDPLSSATDYENSPDKENHAGETSFFHPPGAKSPKPAHILRRRLVDVGDMTMEEPSVQDLLEDEDELEQLHAIEEDDDGNTLTWKDMAKAATPKWTPRHAASFTTPKASPSQRVPLGDLSLREDSTPIARKRPSRRAMTTTTTNRAEPEPVPTCTIAILPPSPQKEVSTPTSQSFSVFSKATEPSTPNTDHLPVQTTDPLGSSVSTLNLPTVTGASIADTSLPLSMSMGSSQSSQSSLSSLSPTLPVINTPPSSHARLRPIRDESFEANRYSVDLGASFQLQLNSSDAVCDLLNEKISFLEAKDDSFLQNLEMDGFDDDDFVPPAPKSSEIAQKPQASAAKRISSTEGRSYVPAVDKPTVDIDRERRLDSKRRSLETINTSPPDQARKSSPDIHDSSVPSTPSATRSNFNSILPSVAGLKIVKKTKTLTRRLSSATSSTTASTGTTGPSTLSRRAPNVPTELTITSRHRNLSSIPSSPVTTEPITRTSLDATVNAQPARRPVAAAQSTRRISGDGPRRVPVSDSTKLSSTAASRSVAPSTATGPRRVPVNSTNVNTPEALPSSSTSTAALKQPTRYAAAGPTSAIPKPISRIPGSRLPAPSAMTASKSRIGVPSGVGNVTTKGIPNRRVT